MRVGIMKSRPAEWFAKTRRISADFFVEDIKVRDYLDKKLARSGVAKVVIRKTLKEGEIIIFASKVGVIMGKNGEKIKALEEDLTKSLENLSKLLSKRLEFLNYQQRLWLNIFLLNSNQECLIERL